MMRIPVPARILGVDNMTTNSETKARNPIRRMATVTIYQTLDDTVEGKGPVDDKFVELVKFPGGMEAIRELLE